MAETSPELTVINVWSVFKKLCKNHEQISFLGIFIDVTSLCIGYSIPGHSI